MPDFLHPAFDNRVSRDLGVEILDAMRPVADTIAETVIGFTQTVARLAGEL